jgi:diguanylate cyclase (GGDEF)-like protein
MGYRVLVADDNGPSRAVVAQCLESEGFDVESAADGSEAWTVLERADAPQIAILDWRMPGLDGVEICRKVRQRGGHYRYLLLLSALGDVKYITNGLSAGADDYIVKPCDLGELLERVRVGCRVVDREQALHSAHEQLKAEHESRSAALAAISMTDELTGLHNRRGFLTLADQHARLAVRRLNPFSIAFMDLNGLKSINDHLGHEAGDQAIREAAAVLRRTVRDADIVARLGGDEFVALLDGGAEAVDVVFERLRRELDALCTEPERRYRLSLSFGAAFFDPSSPRSIEDLLALADQQMYTCKRERRTISGPILLGPTAPPVPIISSVRPPVRLESPLPAGTATPRGLAGSSAAFVEHLLAAWSARRPDGFAHAERMMSYTAVLARALGLSSGHANDLAYAAALHDIGELALPDEVLREGRELSAEDRALKRKHTSFGAELLAGVQHGFHQKAARIVRSHHERWDGQGYPDGLVGDACPRDARIVGIVDAYDNLRQLGNGGPGFDDVQLADYFDRERKRRFEPQLVDGLLEVLGDLRASPSMR